MPRKATHWTQTPEGKKKLRVAQAKAVKTRRAKAVESQNIPGKGVSKERTRAPQAKDPTDSHIPYLFGRIEGLIATYCEGHDLSQRNVTNRLGQLLQRSSSR